MSTMAGSWGWQGSACDGWETIARLREQFRTAQMGGHRGRGGHAGFGGKFPPPWSGPWGPTWEGRWGGGPGRQRAARGDVRLAILFLLSQGPKHGYQLMQEIAERSSGAWNPSPGSIYPALSALADEGLIDDEKLEGRRIFSLTESGRAYVTENSAAIDAVFEPFAAEPDAGLEDLRQLMLGVGAAAMQVIAAGRPEDARRILGRARRELFSVLAEQDDEA